MANQLLLSLVIIFTLSMYQINLTFTYTLQYPPDSLISHYRLALISDHLKQVIKDKTKVISNLPFIQIERQQISPSKHILRSDYIDKLPHMNWPKRDLRAPLKTKRRMLCFSNTVTSFG